MCDSSQPQGTALALLNVLSVLAVKSKHLLCHVTKMVNGFGRISQFGNFISFFSRFCFLLKCIFLFPLLCFSKML